MDSLIVAAILLGLCQILGLVGLGWFLRVYFDRKQAEIEARLEGTLREWVTPAEEGKPSKFAEVLGGMGAVVGQAAARSIMSSLGADKAHVARAANGISDELEAQSNPIMALLSGGKRGKGAALQRLAELIMPMLGPRAGGPSSGNGSGNGSGSITERIRHNH